MLNDSSLNPAAFHIYDTTLRDGAQQEGLNLSVQDKLNIAKHLDALGVGFIEGGWPGANPKDTEFFAKAFSDLKLKNATLAAFGSTRRPNSKVEDEPLVRALLDSQAKVITLVAKSFDRHVELALKTTLAENLNMIKDTVEYLTSQGRTVFLDAEHFFDGYFSNKKYALEVINTAIQAGAELVALCDTNGGMLPDQLSQVVHEVLSTTNARLGIHCHDDTNCAVANTLAAVDAGVTHVQGTANGYGERSGNANLFSVVANLQLKKGKMVVPSDAIKEMTRIAHAVSEITNINPNQHQPYVGFSAFAHKAGLHASAVKIDPMLYQHIDPILVGNDMRTLVSDMAGRASIELKGKEMGYDLSQNKEVLTSVVEKVKDMESRGYTFEAADASFELLLRGELGESNSHYFTVESWKITVEQTSQGTITTEATVKVIAQGQELIHTSQGNGPVNALDNALRVALEKIYPEISKLALIDYKVRILEGVKGTGAVTRVLIETTDGTNQWDTVGVHENVIAASWNAILDAVTYGLIKAHVK
jgi:2-isopropylmalate synthase